MASNFCKAEKGLFTVVLFLVTELSRSIIPTPLCLKNKSITSISRKAKWDAAGYQSLSVYQTEELADDEETFEEQVEMYAPEFGVSSEENTQENCYPPGIYYKTGDASEPLTVFDNTIQSGAVYIPSFVCISLGK